MNRLSPAIGFAILLSFSAGLLSHLLYQRWRGADLDIQGSSISGDKSPDGSAGETPTHRVSFAPFTAAAEEVAVDLPVLVARDVEKIRGLTGRQARIRGRVFRVGHSAKSNTYFLNFGPSREALTAVIFASAVELFDKSKLPPKNFENKEVEIIGSIKDHPQYGLEMVLEHPKQIKIVGG